jgi:2-polyprenyl-6-methoxyphenol hydroxylase-like FAD-dependent oxidoreductase
LYQGDILIGADGIHSKVRNLVFGDSAPLPLFSQRIVVNGFVSSSDIIKPDSAPDFQLPAFMFTPAGMFMAIPIDPKGETIAWGINKAVPEDRTRQGWQDFEKSGEAARFAKGDFASIQTEPVRSILDKSPNEEAKLWAPSYLPDQPSWHSGRVRLIGDAAHALPPNGLGSGLAFEDAAILTRLVVASKERAGAGSEGIDFEAIFAALERVRRPRIEDVRKGNPVAGMGKQTGPWLWYLKKMAMRAYFWWKSGSLSHVAEYNVDEVDIVV